jgi:hypothetical protein
VKTFSIDVAVLVVGGGPVEGRVAKAIDLNFMSPDVGVESFEVVLVDKAKLSNCQHKSNFVWKVCVTHIPLNVRVDCEEADDTGAAKSSKDEETNDQIIPASCLHGLVLKPWLFVLALQSVALEDAL